MLNDLSSSKAKNELSWTQFQNCCDASAGVALDAKWMVVANDEENTLRIYSIQNGGAPVWSQNWNAFTDPDPDHLEMDIEGAARVGEYVFWITSHARNKSGKIRESRYRFFATKWRYPNPSAPSESEKSDESLLTTPPELYPIGVAYSNLLGDLIRADGSWGLGIGSAAKKASEEPGAFNIEALTAWPAWLVRDAYDDNENKNATSVPNPTASVAIALRSPLKNGRAILIPLLNPLEMILESRPANFGDPILLDLDGRGFRGMELNPGSNSAATQFYILAGPSGDDDGAGFRFYTWRFSNQGPFQESDLRSVLFAQGPLHDYNWESVIPLEGDSHDILFLTDEGGRKVESEGEDCKDLPEAKRELKRFHALRWTAP